MIDIIIPTNKHPHHIKKQLKEMRNTIDVERYNIITTHLEASSPTNRNHGLIMATSDIVIMCDDDLTGFTEGWADRLVEPLKDESIIMVSARLMKTKKTPGVMMDIPCIMDRRLYEVEKFYDVVDSKSGKAIPVRAVPSACIAFRRDGTMFDQMYIGAGFEDTDICFQLCCKYPHGRMVINNECKIIHKNEMKNQMNGQLQANQLYFRFKWGLDADNQ